MTTVDSLDGNCARADTCIGSLYVLRSRVCVLDSCCSQRSDVSCGRATGDLYSFRHSPFFWKELFTWTTSRLNLIQENFQACPRAPNYVRGKAAWRCCSRLVSSSA